MRNEKCKQLLLGIGEMACKIVVPGKIITRQLGYTRSNFLEMETRKDQSRFHYLCSRVGPPELQSSTTTSLHHPLSLN